MVGSTKLFSDLYLTKFVDISTKSFFLYYFNIMISKYIQDILSYLYIKREKIFYFTYKKKTNYEYLYDI